MVERFPLVGQLGILRFPRLCGERRFPHLSRLEADEVTKVVKSIIRTGEKDIVVDERPYFEKFDKAEARLLARLRFAGMIILDL